MRPCGPHSSSPCWRHGLALVDCPMIPEQVLLAPNSLVLLTQLDRGRSADQQRHWTKSSSIHPLSAGHLTLLLTKLIGNTNISYDCLPAHRMPVKTYFSGISRPKKQNGPPNKGRAAGKFRYILRIRYCSACRAARTQTAQSMPVSSLAASDIIECVHGGSNTRSTSASTMVGIISSLVRASSTRISPMPQPGAVRVSLT